MTTAKSWIHGTIKMKFVFVKEEVAHALSMSVEEFQTARSEIELLGFPKPITGLVERWSIMDVVNWVNRSTSLVPSKSEQDQHVSTTRLRNLN